MAAGLRAGAAGIPHMLGDGCHSCRPSAPVWTPYPPLFPLSSSPCPPTGQQQQRSKGHSIPSRRLQSPSYGLFWVYCDLRGSRECLQHLLHHICCGCWQWGARAAGSPWERLQRDCVTGKGCEECRANAVSLRVMLGAKVPSKGPQSADRKM